MGRPRTLGWLRGSPRGDGGEGENISNSNQIEIREAQVVGPELVGKGLKPKIARFGKRVPFLRESIALFELLSDPAIGKAKKAVAVAALLYFIDPIDAVPDFIPLAGFVDDAAVIAAAVTYLRKELKNYLI